MTNTPQPSRKKNAGPSPSLEELRKMNETLSSIDNELQQINKYLNRPMYLNKPINWVDRIAKGILLAGLYGALIGLAFQLIALIFGPF